jgi:hypothetical protein
MRCWASSAGIATASTEAGRDCLFSEPFAGLVLDATMGEASGLAPSVVRSCDNTRQVAEYTDVATEMHK